jgi:hypothetical protein
MISLMSGDGAERLEPWLNLRRDRRRSARTRLASRLDSVNQWQSAGRQTCPIRESFAL